MHLLVKFFCQDKYLIISFTWEIVALAFVFIALDCFWTDDNKEKKFKSRTVNYYLWLHCLGF
jgi:hypothetical protein